MTGTESLDTSSHAWLHAEHTSTTEYEARSILGMGIIWHWRYIGVKYPNNEI